MNPLSVPDPSRWRAELSRLQLPTGAWSYHIRSDQAALEPTCLALFALLDGSPALANGMRFLLSAQHEDGSWPAFAGDEEGAGLTGLAVMALNRLGQPEIALQRGIAWLLRLKGRESHWFWRWKFRTTDTQVRFNPAKFGWPWQPGSCSWVVPTAFSLLALKQSFPESRRGVVRQRIECGVQMLLDRACPQGGWNAGNGTVYGVPMAPHLDATAVALLALHKEASTDLVARSVVWLEREVEGCASPWSLAWSVVALHAWRRPVSILQQRLAELADPALGLNTANMAVVALALDCRRSCRLLGVTA